MNKMVYQSDNTKNEAKVSRNKMEIKTTTEIFTEAGYTLGKEPSFEDKYWLEVTAPPKEGDLVQSVDGYYEGEDAIIVYINKDTTLVKFKDRGVSIAETTGWKLIKYIPIEKYNDVCRELMALKYGINK